MKRILLPLIVAALLAGCATPYQNDSLIGGASETALSPTQYQVRFRGNAHTTPDRAADYCLLRCAEIALREGFEFFAIVDERTRVDHSTWEQRRSYQTTIQRTGNGTYSGTTTGGAQTWHYNRPTANNTVVLLIEQTSDGRAYEAAFVARSLKAKYGIKTPDPKPQKWHGFTPEEIEQAAARFEADGQTENAADARQLAADLRK